MLASERERLGARRAALEARARVRRAVRGWFDGEGFLEVETPARVPAPGQEPHLDAIAAPEGGGGGRGREDARWLATSPEYHMKRLAAAGFERIVQIGKAFRGGERGPPSSSGTGRMRPWRRWRATASSWFAWPPTPPGAIRRRWA